MDLLILCKDSSLPFANSHCQLYIHVEPKPNPVVIVTNRPKLKVYIALLNYGGFFLGKMLEPYLFFFWFKNSS